MTTRTVKEKGDALEDAVRAIETAILRSSPAFSEATFVIEAKKIVSANGVRHEVDLHVTATLGPAYEAIFIFECKNWQEKVGKNEIVIFSEKIKVLSAQRGFFVAAGVTADAIAQAKLDPRIELLAAAELDPAAIMIPASFHAINVGHTKASVFFHEGPGASKSTSMDPSMTVVRVNGEIVGTSKFIENIIANLRDDRMNSFASGTVSEGVHNVLFEGERVFPLGEVTVDGKCVHHVTVTGSAEVAVNKAVVLSAFEVATRGRQVTVKLNMPFGEIHASFVELPGTLPAPSTN
jgi:hypothetical protein